jgi:hypothetical protein
MPFTKVLIKPAPRQTAKNVMSGVMFPMIAFIIDQAPANDAISKRIGPNRKF